MSHTAAATAQSALPTPCSATTPPPAFIPATRSAAPTAVCAAASST